MCLQSLVALPYAYNIYRLCNSNILMGRAELTLWRLCCATVKTAWPCLWSRFCSELVPRLSTHSNFKSLEIRTTCTNHETYAQNMEMYTTTLEGNFIFIFRRIPGQINEGCMLSTCMFAASLPLACFSVCLKIHSITHTCTTITQRPPASVELSRCGMLWAQCQLQFVSSASSCRRMQLFLAAEFHLLHAQLHNLKCLH